MMPKMTAPIGRAASATVSVSAMSGRVRPNDFAMSSMTSVRMKKSKASSVQPRKPASTAFLWLARSAFIIVGAGTAVAMVAAGYYGNRRVRSAGLPPALAQFERRATARHAIAPKARRRSGLPCGKHEVHGAGREEADEPRVVVQRSERRHDESAPGQRA